MASESSGFKSAPVVNGHAVRFAKICLYMFGFLFITSAIAVGMGYGFSVWASSDPNAINVLNGIIVGAAILQLILTIVFSFVLMKDGTKAILPFAIIYSVLMGVLLSSFVTYMPWYLLGTAVGITAAIFLVLALVGIICERFNMNFVAMAAGGLIFGAGIVALVAWPLALFANPAASTLIWIVSYAMFGGIMLITIVDFWRINKICKQGELTKDIELYFAFNLYLDFIMILLYVLRFVSAASRH